MGPVRVHCQARRRPAVTSPRPLRRGACAGPGIHRRVCHARVGCTLAGCPCHVTRAPALVSESPGASLSHDPPPGESESRPGAAEPILGRGAAAEILDVHLEGPESENLSRFAHPSSECRCAATEGLPGPAGRVYFPEKEMYSHGLELFEKMK
jgi:hypothetical protein